MIDFVITFLYIQKYEMAILFFGSFILGAMSGYVYGSVRGSK